MKQKDSLLHEALAIARIGCWEWDLIDKTLICTDEVYHLFGLDTNTQGGYAPFLTHVQDKYLPALTEAFMQALQHKRFSRIKFGITRPDGKVCTLEASGQVREDKSGRALTGTLQDITIRNEAEKAFKLSQEQYYFIAEAVPAMIWTAYPEDSINYVNSWMVNYTGLPAHELMDKGWMEAIHPDDREKVRTVQTNALQNRESYQVALRFRRVDGNYRWHIRYALPLEDAEGNITRWIGINADIHEQKLKEEALQENQTLRETQQKLKAEKEFSESILENSINGILAFDKEGQITKWNKHMEFLSGRKREEVLGKSLTELFPEYVQKKEGNAFRQVLMGEKITLRKHSHPFVITAGVYEINLMPLLTDGEVAGGLGIIYEITEIIKLEQKQTNLKLEGQKEVLNAILRAQERERERISESLHNGIGQLLFAVRLNLQTVNFKALEPETGAVLSKVNNLLNEAIRQSRIVSFELVPTILKDFGLQATLEDMAQTLSSPALTIHVKVEGMKKRLEKFLELTSFRIIQALVSNIVEHSAAREASVYVYVDRTNVSIRVADNGKGFDPATATARVKENSLQTVSSRVALLNGKLNIDSAIGKGTTVIAVLPLAK